MAGANVRFALFREPQRMVTTSTPEHLVPPRPARLSDIEREARTLGCFRRGRGWPPSRLKPVLCLSFLIIDWSLGELTGDWW